MLSEEDIKIKELDEKIREREDTIKALNEERNEIEHQREECIHSENLALKERVFQEFIDKFIAPLKHISGKCFRGHYSTIYSNTINRAIDGESNPTRYKEIIYKFKINKVKNIKKIEDTIEKIHWNFVINSSKNTVNDLIREYENYNLWVIFDVKCVSYETVEFNENDTLKEIHLKNIIQMSLFDFYNNIEMIDKNEFDEWYEDIMEQIKMI